MFDRFNAFCLVGLAAITLLGTVTCAKRPTGSKVTPVTPISAAAQKVKFDLGPGLDREVLLFSVFSKGTLEIEIQWQGSANAMYVEIANVAIGKRVGKAALTLEGPAPLSGKVEVGSRETGDWGVGLQIPEGTAQGTLVIRPKRAEISKLKKKQLPLPRLSPEVAKLGLSLLLLR